MAAELEALTPPENVDAVIFEELRQALLAAVRESGQTRFASAAPSTPKNAVPDLWLERLDDTTATAHWTYLNVGDYDQNSEVSGADIAPIAAHFMKGVASPDWAAARLADGDGNGEVNGADIAPIAANFLSTVSAYSVQMTTTSEVEGSWSELLQVPFSDSVLPEGGGKRSFSTEISAAAGQSFRVVPVHGTSAGVAGVPFEYDGVGGKPVMPLEERQAILDGVHAKLVEAKDLYAHLPQPERQDAENAYMLNYLAAQPRVTLPYIENGCVWAEFEDGRPLVVVNNREAMSEEQGSEFKKASARAGAKAASIAYPNGKTFMFFNGTEGSLSSYTQYALDAYAAAGYNTEEHPLTVEALLQLGGQIQPPSILHFDCHGVLSSKTGFALITLTPPSIAIESGHFMSLTTEEFFYGVTVSGSTYAAGEKLLNRVPWQLAPGAFVYLNCCHGGAPEADSFRQKLISFGAGCVLGWDKPVHDWTANSKMTQIYDDALGLDELDYQDGAIDTPPMRPFSIQQILDARGTEDTMHRPGSEYYPVNLAITGNDTILAPSLHYFVIEEPYWTPGGPSAPHTLLKVFGQFGSPGTGMPTPNVWLDNQLLQLVGTATPTQMSAVLPPGLTGGVRIAMNGTESTAFSNSANITEWRGEFHTTITSDTGLKPESVDGTGSFTYDLVFDLHLRLDIRKSRAAMGVDPSVPHDPATRYLLMSTSKLKSFSASGSLTDSEGRIYSESGSATNVPYFYIPIETREDLEVGEALSGDVSVHKSGDQLVLKLHADAIVYIDGTYDDTEPRNHHASILLSHGFDYDWDNPGQLELVIGPDYEIQAGSFSYESEIGPGQTVWDAIPAINPPDPNEGV